MAHLEEAVQISGGGWFYAGGIEIKRSAMAAGCQALPVLLPVQLWSLKVGELFFPHANEMALWECFSLRLLDLMSKVLPPSLK